MRKPPQEQQPGSSGVTRSVLANAYCLARYIATSERDPFDLIASLSFDIYGSWVGLYHAEGIVVVLQ